MWTKLHFGTQLGTFYYTREYEGYQVSHPTLGTCFVRENRSPENTFDFLNMIPLPSSASCVSLPSNSIIAIIVVVVVVGAWRMTQNSCDRKTDPDMSNIAVHLYMSSALARSVCRIALLSCSQTRSTCPRGR